MFTPTPEFPASANSASSQVAPTELLQWLVLLGFPVAVAAASVMPEIFRSEDTGRGSAETLFRRIA